MATAGRKPKGLKAASNSERKKQFDLRMRNANGEVPGAPQRSPVVIYLSEEARDVLRRNREVRRLADAPPVLDAELVEFALASYESQRLGQVSAEHSGGKLPLSADLDQAAFKALQNKVSELEQKVINAATELKDDKFEELKDQAEAELRDDLLAAHRNWQSWLLYPIAQRLSHALSSAEDDAARMRLLHDEISEYLDRLFHGFL